MLSSSSSSCPSPPSQTLEVWEAISSCRLQWLPGHWPGPGLLAETLLVRSLVQAPGTTIRWKLICGLWLGLRLLHQLLPKTLATNTVTNTISVMQLVAGLGLLLAVGQTLSQGNTPAWHAWQSSVTQMQVYKPYRWGKCYFKMKLIAMPFVFQSGTHVKCQNC